MSATVSRAEHARGHPEHRRRSQRAGGEGFTERAVQLSESVLPHTTTRERRAGRQVVEAIEASAVDTDDSRYRGTAPSG